MNKIIEFFNFSFLRKLDRYILLNHPKIWIFKLPYIIFYGFIMNVMFMMLLLVTEKDIYEMPDFISSILSYWVIAIFFLFRWINSNSKIEKEYRRDILSGLEEFLLLLFSIFILGTSLYIIQSTVLLEKYPYETVEYEKLLVYVDDDNYSKTLVIPNVEMLQNSEYKSEYNQIILDLTSVDKKEEITNKVIATAKENYMFYYDLNSYKWIEMELNILLIVALFILYYRIIGMKNLLWTLSVAFFLLLELPTPSLSDLMGLAIYQFIVVLLFYIFTNNRLLVFSMITLSILTDIIYLIDIFIEDLEFSSNLVSILLTFIVILLFVSFVKKELLVLDAEPKDF